MINAGAARGAYGVIAIVCACDLQRESDEVWNEPRRAMRATCTVRACARPLALVERGPASARRGRGPPCGPRGPSGEASVPR